MAVDPVLWPFAGAGDVSWQPEWLTEVLRPSAGLVQHRQLRDEPRVRVTFEGIATGQQRRWLENLLERNGAGRWHVPLQGAGYTLGAPLAAGAAGVPGTTSSTLLRTGGRVALLPDDARKAELFTVADVQPGGIVLDGITANAHQAGTRVLPVFEGRLGAIPTLQRFTGDALPWAADFELAEPLPITASASPVLYRTYPVLDLPLDWSSDPSWQPYRDVLIEDNDTGPVWATALLAQSQAAIKYQCAAEDAGEVQQLLGQLWAMAGRANPVWVHTRGHDLVLSAGMSAGTTAMDVQWAGLGVGPRPPGRRDLRIALRNGTVLHRRVTAVTAPSSNVERLTLDSALGTAITPADVLQLSWMSLCTQSADVVRINWWKHDVAQVELSFQAVPYEH